MLFVIIFMKIFYARAIQQVKFFHPYFYDHGLFSLSLFSLSPLLPYSV